MCICMLATPTSTMNMANSDRMLAIENKYLEFQAAGISEIG